MDTSDYYRPLPAEFKPLGLRKICFFRNPEVWQIVWPHPSIDYIIAIIDIL
jgi:hypothetical protein